MVIFINISNQDLKSPIVSMALVRHGLCLEENLNLYSLGTGLPRSLSALEKRLWRQRGRVFRAPDLKSGGRRFKSCSDHLAGVVSR